VVNVTVTTAGTSGPRGTGWLNGTTTPSDSLGFDGDFYLNDSNPNSPVYYGPKTAGTWTGHGPYSFGTGVSQSWVFDVVETYGAKGDGTEVHDGAMLNNSTTLTCASGPFANAVPGMPIAVKNAGASAPTTLVTTIATRISNTQVTLNAPNASGVDQTNLQVQFGTDDTVAFRNAVNDAVEYAQAHGGLAKVFIPAASSFYVIAGALQTGGSTLGNAQIPLPIIPAADNKVTLIFEGAGNAAAFQHWQQTVTQRSGSTLVSFGVYANSTAQSNDINTNGNPSVIGGPTTAHGYGASALFSNMYVVFKDVAIRTTYSNGGLTWGAGDLYGCAEGSLQNFTYGGCGQVQNGDFANTNTFSAGLSVGFLMPANGNNDNCWVSNVSCQGGYTYAMFISEHFVADRLGILYSWTAMAIIGTYGGSFGASHAINLGQVSIESCSKLINVLGAGQGGQGPWVYGVIDVEGSLSLIDNGSGGLNALLGEVTLAGLTNPSNFDLQHPTGLKIINGLQGYVANVHASDYTVTVLDDTILVDASAGAVTITLISAAWTPNVYHVKKIDSSSNAVAVAAASGELIDGAATQSLVAQWDHTTVAPARVSSVWGWYQI
jgi:hypothetical protein